MLRPSKVTIEYADSLSDRATTNDGSNNANNLTTAAPRPRSTTTRLANTNHKNLPLHNPVVFQSNRRKRQRPAWKSPFNLKYGSNEIVRKVLFVMIVVVVVLVVMMMIFIQYLHKSDLRSVNRNNNNNNNNKNTPVKSSNHPFSKYDHFETESIDNTSIMDRSLLEVQEDNDNNNNDNNPIIHIVNTRFMQHQPNLTTLATARLHLFKTFCLPSMTQQSIQKFYWLIKIDPDLHPSIKNQLISLVESFSNKNIYIIGSNTNFMVGSKIPGSWRGRQGSDAILSNINHNEVYTGDIQSLQNVAMRANSKKIILETRLDADDGLNHRYLEYIQKDALRRFQKSSNNNNEEKKNKKYHNYRKPNWFFWCVEKHAKWYPTKDMVLGKISGERRLDYCITPGLTVGYNVGTRSGDVPNYAHHVLFNQLVLNKTVAESYDCMADQCLTFITKMVAAVRSRTHTSAGMLDVKYNPKLNLGDDMTNWIWQKLRDEFGVMEENVIEMHRFLQENIKEIARENLRGQCTEGHSCKKQSRDMLKQMIVES